MSLNTLCRLDKIKRLMYHSNDFHNNQKKYNSQTEIHMFFHLPKTKRHYLNGLYNKLL